jgi:hypothetical protein
MLEAKLAASVFLIGLLFGASGGGFVVRSYVNSKWESSLQKQKLEATTQLLRAEQRTRKLETENTLISNKLEVESEIQKSKLSELEKANRALAVKFGGLRDPGRRSSCVRTLSSTTAAASESEAVASGSLLSTEATEFLLDFSKQADSAAEYANTCHKWIEQLNRKD